MIYKASVEEALIGTDSPDPERSHGPIAEYDARVDSGRLRDDEHQRSMAVNQS